METPLCSFPGLRLYGVYPSFRTYGVYPFPLFSRKMVYTIAFFALWPRGRATDGEERGSTVVVYLLFSLVVVFWRLILSLGCFTEKVGGLLRKRAEYGQFQMPCLVSFLAPTEFWGESSASSSQPSILAPERTHRVCRRTQWALSSETVLSKQYLVCFLVLWIPPHVRLEIDLRGAKSLDSYRKIASKSYRLHSNH